MDIEKNTLELEKTGIPYKFWIGGYITPAIANLIVKNEVLFIIKTHPQSLIGSISLKNIKEIIQETRNSCFDFYRWKKAFILKQHWLAYKNKICPRCNIQLTLKYLGKNKRRSFFCNNCQILFV